MAAGKGFEQLRGVLGVSLQFDNLDIKALFSN